VLVAAPPGATDVLVEVEPPRRLITGLPNTLLWEPPVAVKRDPRFAVIGTDYENALTDQTADTWIGGTFGLLRISPRNRDIEYQVDAFGVVISRWSQINYEVAVDYRAGVPVTFRTGPWHGKFGYEHTSTHLGDETIVRTGRRPIRFEKDELVYALGRVLFEDRVRVYGLVAWAFSDGTDVDRSPFRYDVGVEVFNRGRSPRYGQPFAAVNVEFNGTQEFEPSVTVQAGWMLRNPDRRLGQIRFLVEYFSGRSQYGQLFADRETFWAFGGSIDY
jgi:hypothetical protein